MISFDQALHVAPKPLARDLQTWTPKTLLGQSIFTALPYLPQELRLELLDRIQSVFVYESALSLVKFEKIDERKGKALYAPTDYGIVSRKVVTDTGVGFLVDAFQNLTEIENMKFHAIGTGTNAEAVGNTALQTELTTQYNPDNTRATGSTTENAANIYRTVGTNAVDSAVSITEHGIMSQAATGGGVLWDRSQFTAVALAIGDSLQSTYDGTFTSGG
jgi:hypothetical protein